MHIPEGMGPGSQVPSERGSRLRVLLCTDGSYPYAAGDEAGWWCESLVRGLPDVEFLLWAVAPGTLARPVRPLPQNISALVTVPLSGPAGRFPVGRAVGPAAALDEGRTPPPAPEREVARRFVPLLLSFLDSVAGMPDSGELAEILFEMHVYFRDRDQASTFQSGEVWEAFKDFMARGAGPTIEAARGTELGPESPGPLGRVVNELRQLFLRPDGSDPLVEADEMPTIAETAQALDHLRRLLAPLAAPVPRAEVTHVVGAGLPALPGIVAKVERGTPLLITEHGASLRDGLLQLHEERLPWIVRRLLVDVAVALTGTAYRLADQVSPVSREPVRWEEVQGVQPERIRVIYPGVDELEYQPARIGGEARPTVVSISPVEPSSDLETMLRVAEGLRAELPGIRVVHHGPVVDHRYWARVTALHEDLGLEGTVEFRGPASHVPAAIGEADVLLVTSVAPRFPISAIEALMCGVPVASTAVGGVQEVLEGIGVVAPPGEVHELARAVLTLIRLPLEARVRISASARARALERFSLSRFVDEYRYSYRSLAEGKAPAGEPGIGITGGLGPPPEREVETGIERIVPPPFEERVSEPSEARGEGETALLEPFEPPRREVGSEAMGAPEEEAFPAEEIGLSELARALSSADPFVRAAAIARVRREPGADEAVVEALADEYPLVRREAVRAMARLGGAAAARALAARAAQDPSAEVREEAVGALASLVTRQGRGRGPGR